MTNGAYSIDGRTFAFEASLADAVPVGSYVTITTPDDSATYLGQVLGSEVGRAPTGGPSMMPTLVGHGALLGRLIDGCSRPLDDSGVFGGGVVVAADAEVVTSHLDAALTSTAGVSLGHLQQPAGVPAVLRAGGFGRHTFLCGQSGSGKTYTLGVILERLAPRHGHQARGDRSQLRLREPRCRPAARGDRLLRGRVRRVGRAISARVRPRAGLRW